MTEEQEHEDLDQVARECAGHDGINIPRQVVTKATAELPEKQRALIRWLYTTARDKRWSWSELVDFAGYSTTTWYRIFHGKRRDNKTGKLVSLDRVCGELTKLKKEYGQPAFDGTEHPFVETSVWERVDWLCNKVYSRKKLGFIYGESHIGKTICMQEFQRRNNHGQTVYWELPPSGGVQLMTRCWARALHVAASTTFEKMQDAIIGAVDREMLVLTDQVHRIFYSYQKTSIMRCLDVLMYVHDRTHCPMVLCGTNVFREQLHEGPLKQYLKQLRRRGLYELQLPDVAPRKDLDMISAAHGLPPATGEAEKVMLQIAKDHGLAMFFTRLEDAREFAAKRRQPLDWKHFVKAVAIVEKMAKLPEGRL